MITLYFTFHISRKSNFFRRQRCASSADNVTAMFTSLRPTNSKSRFMRGRRILPAMRPMGVREWLGGWIRI